MRSSLTATLLLASATATFASTGWARLDEVGGAGDPVLALVERAVYRAEVVYDGAGNRFAPGFVVVENGKVVAVGASAPSGSEARDFGPGSTITPGLVDAGAELNLSGGNAEDGAEIVPRLRVADALDPSSREWGRLRANGVTTAYVTPSGRSLIAGRGAVVKCAPGNDDAWILDAASQMKATMGGEPAQNNLVPRFGTPTSIFYRRPTTRMGVVWEFRKAFFDAQEASRSGPVEDPDLRVLDELLKKGEALRVRARLLQDIRAAIRLTAEFGIPLVLEEGNEAWRSPEELRAVQAKLVLGPIDLIAAGLTFGFGFGGGSARATETDRIHLGGAKLLHEAGIEFAFGSAEFAASEQGLATQVALHVHNGLPRDVALAACTSIPARLLGVANRVGTLSAGKDADFVVWSGEPFEFTTRSLAVVIDGVLVDGQDD